MRPNCECCDTDLQADGTDAFICSFECTFCADCTNDHLGGICPNCGGGLVQRPSRATVLHAKFPPSGKRVTNDALKQKYFS